MAPSSAGTNGYNDAKDFLDKIGQQVHKEVKNGADAKIYKEALKGDLKQARFPHGKNFEDPKENACLFEHTTDTNVTNGRSNPCYGRQGVRFSDTEGAKCYSRKISDESNTIGFCAPYRRLHLCVKNLEQIRPDQITNTHNLLVDVLLAAKYEGQSITQDYPKYRATYGDSGFTMCTMLARSFADIGDIIRGKDLFLGDQERKHHLENRLEQMFKNIMQNNGEISKRSVEEVREYWWALNRDQVWKAITCNAGGSQYFRQTCSEEPLSKQKCSCPNAGVPTYFDYVPQYLRWFEEWAEDFCRKKKKKVENLQKSCRGKYKGADRYCSRNGYDCEKTKRAIGKLRYGKQCISCLYACNPYVDWINNQKEQFDKQKKQCETVISGKPRQKRDAHGGSNDN
ncbi:hypothetical protein PFFCH_00518, partial [Plasmodium falciparum FCH/4]